MAHRLLLLLSMYIITIVVAVGGAIEKPVFVLTLRKDKVSNLYYTSTAIGNVEQKSLTIDLSGSAVLLGCSAASKSATYRSIHCRSPGCKLTKAGLCFKNTTCGEHVKASFLERPVNARLGQDNITFSYTTNGAYTWTHQIQSLSFLITCTKDTILKPLSPLTGSIGLAKSRLSLPSQFTSHQNIPATFALCLPSKPEMDFELGDLFIGGGPYFMLPYTKDIRKIFKSTPLMNTPSGEYFIDVKSIQIDKTAISLGKKDIKIGLTTKICTVTPYTMLHTSIYNAVVNAFIAKVKMNRVAPVKPFGACFDSKESNKSMMGHRGVPAIDLVVRGGAKWRIHGSNSLVNVKKDVVCLGFVDGGKNMKPSIVIGGYQMEDNLVEFDLKASKFSFSSSLLLHNTSCAHARLM